MAQDGIYTAIYRDFLSQGKYKMRFFANGDEGSARISRSGYLGRASTILKTSKRARRDLRSQKKWAFDEQGAESQLHRMSRTENERIGIKYDPLSDTINVVQGPVSKV